MEKIYTLSDCVKLYKDWVIPFGRATIQWLCDTGHIKHHRRNAWKFTKISITESNLMGYFKGQEQE